MVRRYLALMLVIITLLMGYGSREIQVIDPVQDVPVSTLAFQADLSESTYSTQNPEPNPEILNSSPWPYWYWGVYNLWWHQRFC